MPRNPDKKRCKAHNRAGEQCRNFVRNGQKVCRFHGGGGGAPKGNKNALTTGEYENIFYEFLDEEEKNFLIKSWRKLINFYLRK